MITSPSVPVITEPWKIGPLQGGTPGSGKPPTHPAGAVQKSGATGTAATTQPQGATTPPQPSTTQPTPAGANAAPGAVSFQNYQQAIQHASQDPNFVAPPPLDEAAWNAMTPEQRYTTLLGVAGDGQLGPGGWLLADPNQSAAYTAKFGAPTGQLVFGYGDPSQFGKGPDAWAVDPTRILRLPDGSWVMDSANVDQNKWGALRTQDDQSGLNLTPLTTLGFPLVVGGLGDLGVFGASAIPGATPAAIADTITTGVNTTIDTSLLPEVTAPTIPDLPAPPDIIAPPGLPPGGGAGGVGGFDTSTTPPEVLNPTMQAPPPPEPIAPPDFNITGGGSLVDRITNGLTRDPLRTIGAGLSAASLLGHHTSGVPQNVQNTVNQNTPLANQARDVLSHNGQPTPDQMSVINDTIEQQRRMGTEAIIQSSINSGMGGKDSMVTQDKIRAFGEQLAVMKEQMVLKQAEQNVLDALKELGMVDNEQFMLAELEIQQNTAAQQRASSIMQSLGWLFSLGSGGKP